ncbi:MAG: DUF3108 domain-containing protein [Candidatus Omnitrophica bacterium]|nr:DUF3108 domain-containing protein [Candidatus Omnitrophota bacterium]
MKASFTYWSLILGLAYVLFAVQDWQFVYAQTDMKPITAIDKAPFTIPEGEKLKFSVRWLGLEVGTAEVMVKGMENIRGRDAYHIVAFARSNSLIDLVYPVRDEHHSYIDKEHLHSLRYEKILREGRYRADEVIDFDQENHTAIHFSRKNGTKKQVLIAKNVQDEISSAYWFRMQPMKVGDVIHIPANSDEKNWDFEVKVLERDQLELKKLGVFDAFQIEPSAKFQGVFIRRGKIRGWMSTDEKRLPLMMKTKIPVLGTITVILVGYERQSINDQA